MNAIRVFARSILEQGNRAVKSSSTLKILVSGPTSVKLSDPLTYPARQANGDFAAKSARYAVDYCRLLPQAFALDWGLLIY